MSVTASLSAADTYSDGLEVDGGLFDFSLSGTWSGTITIQRKRVGEADSAYHAVATYIANDEETGEVAGRWLIRAGFESGDYTSGTAVIELSI